MSGVVESVAGSVEFGYGQGLKGIPGIHGWYRNAVADFIRHCDDEGRENEAVGIFILEPINLVESDSGACEVVWQAKYLACENELVTNGRGGAARKFEVGPAQLEKISKEAEIRQDRVFESFRLGGYAPVGRRYNPLMGIGHSHPRGSVSASSADIAAFSEWMAMQQRIGQRHNRITVTGHFIYAFGGLTDTLVMFDEEGRETAQVRGNFVPAVQ